MLKHWVWLSELRGLGNQARLSLLRHFGSPEEVFYADAGEILLTEGITKEQARALEDHSLDGAGRILEDCRRLGLRILTIQDSEYPDRLKNIYDPPFLLYVRGRLPAIDDEAAVAVVGTRSCTPYGIACAEKLGYGLTAGGGLVVSGLAKGVDAAASRGALRAGGATVGVAGNGLDVPYPRENAYLYEDIAAAGALLSEYPPGAGPARSHFPVRNRILSGLSLAVLVVEAPARSGALITAATALEQGKDVYAVPGPIDAPSSAGCIQLLHDGAVPVSEAWDVLGGYAERFPEKLRRAPSRAKPRTMGYQARKRAEPKPPAPAPSREGAAPSVSPGVLSDDQAAVLRTLDAESPSLVDDLIERTGIPTRRVLSALTLLEIEGMVRQHSGKRYTRTVELQE